MNMKSLISFWINLFTCAYLSFLVNGEESEIARDRMKIMVPAKTESCFFIAQLKESNVVSIRFLVVSYKDGKQQDITFRLKDPKTTRLLNYQARKGHGNFSNFEVKTDGELELCFNNRHSMLDSKTLIWEYDVVGEENFVMEDNQAGSSNETLAEYLAEAEIVRRSVIKVRSLMARGKHTQWWLGQKVLVSILAQKDIQSLFQYPKDTARLESIMSMIDKWSMAHSFLVVVVAITQVTLLKRFFNITPTSTQLKMRI